MFGHSSFSSKQDLDYNQLFRQIINNGGDWTTFYTNASQLSMYKEFICFNLLSQMLFIFCMKQQIVSIFSFKSLLCNTIKVKTDLELKSRDLPYSAFFYVCRQHLLKTIFCSFWSYLLSKVIANPPIFHLTSKSVLFYLFYQNCFFLFVYCLFPLV